jgi:hypothetical protein
MNVSYNKIVFTTPVKYNNILLKCRFNCPFLKSRGTVDFLEQVV